MMLMLFLLASQWLQAMTLFLFVFLDSLVALSCDVPFPCDFFHALLLNILVAPSHDAPFVIIS
jgi:hypothetical protein